MGVTIRKYGNNHNALIYNYIYSNILLINSFVFRSYGYWRYLKLTDVTQTSLTSFAFVYLITISGAVENIVYLWRYTEYQ